MTRAMDRWLTLGTRGVLAALLLLVALVPLLFSTFVTSQVGLTSLWLGIVAVSLTFLSGYGGMVSLAQTALFGVAGLIAAKLSVEAGWNPWAAALAGILAATAVGLLFGAVASGSQGIYFLIITLAFAQVTYFYFAAVPTFGAHEGINGVPPPDLIGDPVQDPARMYYFLLAVSVLVFLGLRHVSRTAFGLALQGVRDDPVRMAALGYNVRLHRTLGFTLAAPVAGAAGVLSAWSNTRMSAGSISLGIAILVLTTAVIGGLNRLEGAWVGALLYTLCDTYLRGWTDRFTTWLGVVFLVIVLVSPGGVVGLLGSAGTWIRRHLAGPPPAPTVPSAPAAPVPVSSRSAL
ncbi:ABC transporter ATP-binding protein [Modestobacter italicus]|uniref:ABC transporter ATP-binding protein n=2 Tax=Modestobacter italicus (strain DSM 44449 / CECT 9708 / BC 501) TaxID=2732864 RepID=I4EWM4_MODI5|nr:ABC transporter ATP-binding protein [Modestobacter marinus]